MLPKTYTEKNIMSNSTFRGLQNPVKKRRWSNYSEKKCMEANDESSYLGTARNVSVNSSKQ